MRRHARRTSSGHTSFFRTELVAFAPDEVEYAIHGSIIGGSRGSWEAPPAPGELEIDEVRRVDPITGKDAPVDLKDWPFDKEEMKEIEERLCENMDSYDYADDDDYDYDDSHGH